jgi:hypothetical protein
VHPRQLSVITALAVVVACAADGSDSADANAEPSWVVIASPYAWVETPLAEDPFAALRPEDVTCDPTGHGFHDFGGDPSYEIDTGLCNYLSISQAALQALPAGTTVEFRVWHFELEADGPAEAYLALDVDSHLVFERTVLIPSASELLTEEFELPADVPLGAPVTMHLHNHGANTWNVLSLEALVSSP